MGEETCKRCSVTRVNTLCVNYDKAHLENDPKALHRLKEVASLVQSRGYREGLKLLQPGLVNQHLRAFCWNVSSFLKDEDMMRIFDWVPKNKS